MKFYETLNKILNASKPTDKFEHLEKLWDAFQVNSIEFEECDIQKLETPSYQTFCTIVDPRILAKRTKLSTLEGRLTFIHAIAHIEYSAVDLAIDAAYRYRGMPHEYYKDWLEVAHDEMRHFILLEGLLKQQGSFYGALPVHDALFEAAERTQHSFIDRMAIVPRFMEANGLDANPRLITRLSGFAKETFIQEFIEVLKIILDEEVDHVLKGDRWFSYACEQEGVDKDIYFDIVEKYYPDTFPKHIDLNIKARQEAGFSCSELKRIGDVECYSSAKASNSLRFSSINACMALGSSIRCFILDIASM
jgi:uncharacterized ferritin-like protein (DUF455 family)